MIQKNDQNDSEDWEGSVNSEGGWTPVMLEDGSPSSTAGNNCSSVAAPGNPEVGLPKLTRHQIITLIFLSFAYFCNTTVFSCIAPFFPSEAQKNGASQIVIGTIFGVFELVILLASPVFGSLLTLIGARRLYTAGLLLTGAMTILFGLLIIFSEGSIFVGLCFGVRMLEALGDAASITASYAIVAHEFPGRISTVIGVMETFGGLGYMAGPPIGGALYQLGGYKLPFIVLGSLNAVAGILSVFCVPPGHDDSESNKTSGICGLIRFPAIWLMSLATVINAITTTFVDPTLEDHLATFRLTPLLIGLIFLVLGGTYSVAAPLFGCFINKIGYSDEIMIFGTLFTAICYLVFGPSPILHAEKSIWSIILAELIGGIGVSALYIPLFEATVDIASSFLGATVFGGAIVGEIGFSWTATSLSGLSLLLGAALICRQILTSCMKRKNLFNYSTLDDENSQYTGVVEDGSVRNGQARILACDAVSHGSSVVV